MQWMVATFLTLGLSASAGYAAWAAQPGTGQPVGAIAAATQDGLFLLARQNSYDGVMGPGVLHQWVKAGEPAISTVGDGPAQWKNTAIVEAGAQAGTAVVRMRIEHGVPGATVAEPVLVVRFGETAAVEQADSSGKVAYRTQLMVLPLSGSREATEQRMRDLLAEAVQSTSPVQSSNLPAPSYPADAARNGIDGNVMLRVTVRPDGSVADIEVEGATPAGVFETAAVEAARQWRFTPAMHAGKPVEGQVRVPITFSTAPSTGASPVAMSDFADYQWMRIPRDGEAVSVCDVVRIDDADGKRIFCGVRKALVAR